MRGEDTMGLEQAILVYMLKGFRGESYILKQTWWCLSLWTKIGQCLEDSSSHCPFPVELVTNRAGQGGQGSRCRGPCEVPFLLKKSLGKTEGLTSNQTKIQFF
jgi:hypothetical protein